MCACVRMKATPGMPLAVTRVNDSLFTDSIATSVTSTTAALVSAKADSAWLVPLFAIQDEQK